MSLIKTQGLPIYKQPSGFKYHWAYEMWEKHDAMVWHKNEYDLSKDVQHFHKADETEKTLITNIMKLFTENDTLASTGYATMLRIFKPFEVYGMLSSFNDREITHTHNYANFTETIGLPNSIYSEFLDIPVMSTKTEYMDKAKVRKYEDYKAAGLTDSQVDKEYRRSIARMLAVYAGGLEGIALMAQFAMLLTFQEKGKYPGLCTIVEWSVNKKVTSANETYKYDDNIQMIVFILVVLRAISLADIKDIELLGSLSLNRYGNQQLRFSLNVL